MFGVEDVMHFNKTYFIGIMLASSYQRTFPNRINTEFIGIASKYSQQKQRRKTQQDRKKSLQSNYQYSEHKQRRLSRTIYSKSVELSRLQSSRLRKLEEIKAKEELNELRQYQLDQLRSRNNKLRQQNKRKLEIARNRLATMNHEGWVQLKDNLKSQTQSLKKRIEDKLKLKAKQCSLIRERESLGLQRIDSFHKRKNSENLEAYLQRIKQQNKIKKELEAKTHKIMKDLKKINKSVDLKKNFLNCLDEQINKYRTDVRVFNKTHITQKSHTEQDYPKGFDKSAFACMYKDSSNKSR